MGLKRKTVQLDDDIHAKLLARRAAALVRLKRRNIPLNEFIEILCDQDAELNQ